MEPIYVYGLASAAFATIVCLALSSFFKKKAKEAKSEKLSVAAGLAHSRKLVEELKELSK